jgi:hypothetical protein
MNYRKKIGLPAPVRKRSKDVWPLSLLCFGLCAAPRLLSADGPAWLWETAAHPSAVTSSVRCAVSSFLAKGRVQGVSSAVGSETAPFESRVRSAARAKGLSCLDATVPAGSLLIIR